jgi:hypothetical protein
MTPMLPAPVSATSRDLSLTEEAAADLRPVQIVDRRRNRPGPFRGTR